MLLPQWSLGSSTAIAEAHSSMAMIILQTPTEAMVGPTVKEEDKINTTEALADSRARNQSLKITS